MVKRGNNSGCVLDYPNKALTDDLLSARGASLKMLRARGIAHGAVSGQAEPISTEPNMLIHGDNLEALKALVDLKKQGRVKNADGSAGARLIYIDPPFTTGLKFKGAAKEHAYSDALCGAAFVEFLRLRLILMRELLSNDGSIYVHLDWKIAHYVKVIMDEIFGPGHFLNDIIWSYGGRGAKAIAGQFSRNHDIILLYEKEGHVFNRIYTQRRIHKSGSGLKADKDGRWFKTAPRGDYTDASIAALKKEGRVHVTKNGKVRVKYFLKDDGDHVIEDRPVGDVWDDIPDAMHLPASEKTGYPTQKPEALLSRIICASSNPGDLVLDAFAGSGTALCVAEKLGRRWIGIDSGSLAIRTIEERLLKLYGPDKHSAEAKSVSAGFSVYKAGKADG